MTDTEIAEMILGVTVPDGSGNYEDAMSGPGIVLSTLHARAREWAEHHMARQESSR